MILKDAQALLQERPAECQQLIDCLLALSKTKSLLSRGELVDACESFLEANPSTPLRGSTFLTILRLVQEAVLQPPFIFLAVRIQVGVWRYIKIGNHKDIIRTTSAFFGAATDPTTQSAASVADSLTSSITSLSSDGSAENGSSALKDGAVADGVGGPGEDLEKRPVATEITTSVYLKAKEHLVDPNDEWLPEIDLRPFDRGTPSLREAKSIGRGVEFLNRYLSGRMFYTQEHGQKKLVEFLSIHNVRGKQLMINKLINSVEDLSESLRVAVNLLEEKLESRDKEREKTNVKSPRGSLVTDNTPDLTYGSEKCCADYQEAGIILESCDWLNVCSQLQGMGFEAGWGCKLSQIKENMEELIDILEAPSPENMERFLSRMPMIFTVAIISPHGFFGQSNVLGLPDTGGQVVYILQQVRALEQAMRESIASQGINVEPRIFVVTRLIPDAGSTGCDRPKEKIHGTTNAEIIRIPFRDSSGKVIRHWISRFKVWPYLERFAMDVQKEIERMGEKPDFVLGNYTDGNLVASILARNLGITQCNIAHALEKTKYPNSDVYWKDMDEKYHFSCQFCADVLAMNSADFIITSSFQEIAGTAKNVGQYESYSHFTMPKLFRVVSGVNVYDYKFNIIPPGADPEVFFPFPDSDRRKESVQKHVQNLIFGEGVPDTRGYLSRPTMPIVFCMSRLDKVKNAAGLVEWYAKCDDLRARANLLLIGGQMDPNLSRDEEEKEEICHVIQLFKEFNLDSSVRWVKMQTDKEVVGEFYRIVADHQGAFVQPALYEGFGLTVIEAMNCGLPVFGTRYGGPVETIQDCISGFHIDPYHGAESALRMANFFKRCEDDPDYWPHISENAISRVVTRYTWKLHAERLLSLSRIYGFWKFMTRMNREETKRYLEMFYAGWYRRLAAEIPYVEPEFTPLPSDGLSKAK